MPSLEFPDSPSSEKALHPTGVDLPPQDSQSCVSFSTVTDPEQLVIPVIEGCQGHSKQDSESDCEVDIMSEGELTYRSRS